MGQTLSTINDLVTPNEKNNETKQKETTAAEAKEEKIPDEWKQYKYKIPKLSKEELETFRDEVINVYKHECKCELNGDNSISFYPSPHIKPNEYGKQVFDSQLLCNSWLVSKNVDKLDGISDWNEKIISEGSVCSFITVCCKAWTKHYPLKISPSHILLLILQSVAIHVDKNSEKLRNKYVSFTKGKKELSLYRDLVDDNFKFGSKHNDWSSVINEFCKQIDKNTVSDTVDLMESNFSCSTMVDKISNKITIMDICKNYFQYSGASGICCGFPKITLNGTKYDWINLKIKCEKILSEKVDKKFGEKWKLSLLRVLDRFIAVYDGNIDCVFWNSMIRQTETSYYGSGMVDPEQYRGWINVFFPYINHYNGFKENDYCFKPYEMKQFYERSYCYEKQDKRKDLKEFGNGGSACKNYPTGLSSAPVKWTDQIEGKEYKLKFYSGFTGYKQCPKTLELSPVVSWFIGHSQS